MLVTRCRRADGRERRVARNVAGRENGPSPRGTRSNTARLLRALPSALTGEQDHAGFAFFPFVTQSAKPTASDHLCV